MIQLSYLDYSAVEGKSFLHRLSPALKIIGMLLVLFVIVTVRNLPGLFLLYVILLTVFFMARIPKKIFSLTLYPSSLRCFLSFFRGFKSFSSFSSF